MTCPISCPISCLCQCTDPEASVSAPAQFNPNGAAATPPIVRQPLAQGNATEIHATSAPYQAFGGYVNPSMAPLSSILETIRGAGSLVTDLINSPQSQRSLRSCRDYCNNYCCFSMPSWMQCIFGCCCDSLIKDDDPNQTPNVVVETIQRFRDNFGPVVLGLAIGYAGLNLHEMIAKNEPLTPEQETRLLQACQQAREIYSSLIVQSVREPLVRSAESIQTQAEETQQLAKYVCKALQRSLLKQPIPKQSSKFLVILSSDKECVHTSDSATSENTSLDEVDGLSLHSLTPEDSTDAGRTVRSINWNKLYQQLKKLLVCDLNSDDTFPLGSQARNVVLTLRHALYLMAQGDPSFIHPDFGYFLHTRLLLKLLNIILAGSGYIPVRNETTFPCNREDLSILGGAIRDAANEQVELRHDETDDSHCPQVASSTPEGSTSSLLGSDDEDEDGHEDITSPAAQERILRTCQKTSSLYSIILG